MELLAKVIEVCELNNHTYTDRQGQQQTIISRQVMLKRGEDTFFAEATGDRAVNMPTDLNGANVWVRLSLTARKGKTKEGAEFKTNNINLYNIERV